MTATDYTDRLTELKGANRTLQRKIATGEGLHFCVHFGFGGWRKFDHRIRVGDGADDSANGDLQRLSSETIRG